MTWEQVKKLTAVVVDRYDVCRNDDAREHMTTKELVAEAIAEAWNNDELNFLN